MQPVDVESCDFVYHAELRVEHPHPHERDCHERSDGRHVEQTSEGVFAFDEFGAEQQGQAETKHNAEECGNTCEYRRVPHGSPEKFVCEDLFEVVESDPIISANQRIPVMQTAREGFKNWVGQENGEIDHQEDNSHVA